ncbi:MAG: hypothetical protein COT33_01950 [Candidatus Nealsonbacteria bacterium CG08_land_8_20_14_0_20_38_20]|uniref:DUF4258 domain-containing protein n=1 Tax=Candidatus Nealsonbacteria bacterium CG08_land_8_20_14_0_20_38_20 TaxID=1974705 RepID=A0A2H0YLR9_9BACT|nr:MAG: hypothetical protein COT33_01950 [Candidatus Nealsonbacteria bacterium CG08_land_8_20_14_0_20_38_20]
MIIFTNHALLKLRQRGISPEVVRKTLKSPDYTIPSYSERIIVYKKFDRLYLKVVYKVEEDNIIVITQHWEEKPKLIK